MTQNRFWFDVRNYIDMVHDEFLMTDEFQTKESLWSAFWDGTEDKHPYHGEGNTACDKAYKKGRRMMGAKMQDKVQDLSVAWGRWSKQPTATRHGRGVQLRFKDGTNIGAHYALVESGAVSASHVPMLHYRENDGYPCDMVSGKTMARKDYAEDRRAQQECGRMAHGYDGRAVDDCPIVSFEGIVLRGNLRVMAGMLAARWQSDEQYIDHLRNHCQKYGFTEDDVAEYRHPRLVVVVSRQKGHQYAPEDFVRYESVVVEQKRSDATTL